MATSVTPRYRVGNTVSFYFKIEDKLACQLIDPDVVRLKLKEPDGVTEHTYTHGVDQEIVRQSRGYYIGNVTLDVVGTWKYLWECSGPVDGAEDGIVLVSAGKY